MVNLTSVNLTNRHFFTKIGHHLQLQCSVVLGRQESLPQFFFFFSLVSHVLKSKDCGVGMLAIMTNSVLLHSLKMYCLIVAQWPF